MASSTDFQKVVAEMGKMSKDELHAFNEQWTSWGKEAGVSDMGAPVGQNKRVTANDVKNEKNEVGGYTVIEAESHEDAAKKMQNHPHFKVFPNGWIDVMEVVDM